MNFNYYFHADDFGRSIEISKGIFKSLKEGNLNSVSVIVNYVNDNYHFKLKKIKNINKRLHLNLTEIPETKLINNNLSSKISFVKLIFYNKSQKNKIYKEIDSQIIEYKRLYNPKKLKIDGHQHVHMIPWILKYLLKIKNKHKIEEIRCSNEIFILPTLGDLLKLRYYRNLIAFFILKFFYFISKNPKLSDFQFFGMIYSGFQSEEKIIKYLKLVKKMKIRKFEILLHPGFASKKEKKIFKNDNFNFYGSRNRIKEAKLTFSSKIKNLLNTFD